VSALTMAPMTSSSALWTAASRTLQLGSSITNTATAHHNGLFYRHARISGANFPSARPLDEVSVRTNGLALQRAFAPPAYYPEPLPITAACEWGGNGSLITAACSRFRNFPPTCLARGRERKFTGNQTVTKSGTWWASASRPSRVLECVRQWIQSIFRASNPPASSTFDGLSASSGMSCWGICAGPQPIGRNSASIGQEFIGGDLSTPPMASPFSWA